MSHKNRFLILLGCLLLIAAGPLVAADEAEEETAAEPELPRSVMMGQPGPVHEMLMARTGTWRVKIQITMPDGEVLENSGIMQSEAVLDGRFITSLFKSSFMGQPFLGRSMDGYDNETQEYFSFWFDNTSTQIIHYRGTSDDDGKTITYFANTIDPETGETVQLKSIHRAQSTVQHTVEEFRRSSDDEEWVLAMREISSR